MFYSVFLLFLFSNNSHDVVWKDKSKLWGEMHERIIVNLVCSENSICLRTLNLNTENTTQLYIYVYAYTYRYIYVLYISETNDTQTVYLFPSSICIWYYFCKILFHFFLFSCCCFFCFFLLNNIMWRKGWT